MKNKIRNYIIIIIFAIIVSIPLFSKDINIYNDDGIQHVCRLIGTYQSITEENQSFPVIMSSFCNNFGYSWNLFYSPLTAYVPLLFRLFTNSYVICLKAFIILITILTGISMYEFVNKITKNQYAGLLASIIYMFAPYRLTDMYIRYAVAELASFIFLPMIFQGIYTIFSDTEKKHNWMLFTLGATGLILTHIIVAMYTAIIGFVYVLINIRKLKEKNVIKKLIISLLSIILITSFYLAPMLEHKINTNYEVFQEGRMERTNVLIDYKLDLLELVYTKQNSMSYEIGLITIVGVILTIIAIKNIGKEYKSIYIYSLVMGILSILITLKWFPFEKMPSILKMIQFPFRMLEFSSFFLAFVAGVNYSVTIKNFRMRDVLVLSTIAVLLVVPLKKNIQHKEISEDWLIPSVPVNKYTLRVHAGCASFEYLPSNAFQNLDYIKQRENKTYVIQGKAEIQKEQKDGTNMQIDISNVDENTILELPYIYYLGYNVNIEKDEESSNLQIQESEKGFIQIKIDQKVDEAKIIVSYTGTKIMKISAIISFMSFTILLVIYVLQRREITIK